MSHQHGLEDLKAIKEGLPPDNGFSLKWPFCEKQQIDLITFMGEVKLMFEVFAIYGC